jgi:trimeric autotransporter adhesin
MKTKTKSLKISLIIVLSALSQVSDAQWTTSGTHIYNSNTGNVGIGTPAPGFKLDVSGNINIMNSNNRYMIGGLPVLNVKGTRNTFAGKNAGNSNAGLNNTAFGFRALYSNTTANSNTAVGSAALYNNIDCNAQTAVGDSALYTQSINGSANTAVGAKALFYADNYVTGNSALGYQALYHMVGNGTTPPSRLNTAIGHNAMHDAYSGDQNTAVGASALAHSGLYNTAVGVGALAADPAFLTDNTALGYTADVSVGAGVSSSTVIGSLAIVNASSKIRLGSATVMTIEGQVAYSFPSDQRFKFNVNENVKGLEFINSLRPVTYQFDTKKFDDFLMKGMPDERKQSHLKNQDYASATAVVHTGFIAQEVEKNAKACGFNFDGVHAPSSEYDNYSIAYSQFVVPLVKAVQELSKQNNNLQAENNSQQKQIEELKSMVQQLAGNEKKGTSLFSKTAALDQNSPNPFSQQTLIGYVVPAGYTDARVEISDISGHVLKSQAISEPGKGQFIVKANELSAGTYQYTLIIDEKVIDSRQMILTK